VDFPALFLDLAGVQIPNEFQGRSFRSILQGKTPDDWRKSMYYRYWMNKAHHNVAAHYGVRTHRHKLIYYYYDGCGQKGTKHASIDGSDQILNIEGLEPEWELYDLKKDPMELNNLIKDPSYADVVKELKNELHRLQAEIGDERYHKDLD
jgi:arylsulfatase A-like enzyme